MTAGTIDKLHAVTSGGSVTEVGDAPTRQGRIPTSLPPEKLIVVLRNLDLAVPSALSIAAGRGERLSTSRHRYTIKEITAALARHNVPMSEGLHLKTELGRHGIMEN